MPKNIVIFADGTGQNGEISPTPSNVYKLFQMMDGQKFTQTNMKGVGKGQSQISFYDAGVGSQPWSQFFRKIEGMLRGIGISTNIKQCYAFICDHYKNGDKIYIFGFSRGAATARSLSGLINLFGLVKSKNPKLIKQAYRIYKIRNKAKRKKRVEDFKKKFTRKKDVRVKCLGVWDTVAMLSPLKKLFHLFIDKQRGNIYHEFHDLTLSPSVDAAFHALAVDEERNLFRPVLWNNHQNNQFVRQIWFPGVHSDIGGSYAESDLSDITLDWMLKMIRTRKLGLKIRKGHPVRVKPNHMGLIHRQKSLSNSERGKALKGLLKSPSIHLSVNKRKKDGGKKYDGGVYDPWILRE